MKKWHKKSIAPALLLFVSITLFSQNYNISVPFELSNFRFEKADSFTSIQCVENKEIRYPMPAGDPNLPYIPFYVLMPHSSSIKGISIEEGNFGILEGNYRIAPKSIEESNSDSAMSAFHASLIMPANSQIVIYDSAELYAGFLINRIFVSPFRYNEKEQQLLFTNKMIIKIVYQTNVEPLKYETSPEKIELCREFIKEMVINREEINKVLPLEKKMDYSKVHIYKDIGKDSGKSKTVEPLPEKSEEVKPFYIKQIKTR